MQTTAKFYPVLLAISALLMATLACTFRELEPTPSPLPPTFTPDFTATAVAAIPTATETPQATVTPSPTATASITSSPTATVPRVPASTPHPSVALQFDADYRYEIAPELRAGFDRSWLAFTHIDDSAAPEDEGGGASGRTQQTLYVVNPDTRERIPVIDLPATTENRLYWSPDGQYLAYFLREGESEVQPEGGVYILSLETGISRRLYDVDTLQPRGLPGHQPIWSPDSTQLIMVLPTAYATDIFTVNANGTGFHSLTNSPAYDFFPAWSPDGQYLAFVSERAYCPTREPEAPDTCDAVDAGPPSGGNLYLYELETGTTRKVNDTVLNAPPEWIDNRYIAVSAGSLDPFSAASDLWLYDVVAGSAWSVSPEDGASYMAAAWRGDVSQVAYQRASTDGTALVLADRLGAVQATTDEFIFPRFGVSLDWSPDGEYLAAGGRNGQCPYGLIIFDNTLDVITAPVQNILACDPVYEPGGDYLAFVGTRSSLATDGRTDIYLTSLTGTATRSLTSDLEGRVQLIGWLATR